jgi:hypothetical protein
MNVVQTLASSRSLIETYWPSGTAALTSFAEPKWC